MKKCFGSDADKNKIRLYKNRIAYEILQRDVLYVSAYNGYIEAKVGKQTLRRDISLKKLESLLDPAIFYRINKSCIVNMLKIENYENGKIKLDEFHFDVARRKRKNFESVFQNFVEKEALK